MTDKCWCVPSWLGTFGLAHQLQVFTPQPTSCTTYFQRTRINFTVSGVTRAKEVLQCYNNAMQCKHTVGCFKHLNNENMISMMRTVLRKLLCNCEFDLFSYAFPYPVASFEYMMLIYKP